MTRLVGFAAAFTLLGAAAPAPRWHATGPPVAHTGGFGEPTCAICHEGDDVNAFGGSVAILDLPNAYEPGEAYVLRVSLEAPETGVAGFQLSARHAAGPLRGKPAGTVRGIDSRVTVTMHETGQPYAHHTPVGTEVVTSEGSSWLVEWTAPLEGEAVVFHVAANSANGDNSPLLDLVYVAEASVGREPFRPERPFVQVGRGRGVTRGTTTAVESTFAVFADAVGS